MKQITTIAVTAFLAISVVSCSKSSYSDVTGQTQPNQVVPRPEVNVVSQWIFPISFSVESDNHGNNFIKGVYPFTAATQINYDESAHVELVYARVPSHQRIPYQYRKLPHRMNVEVNGNTGIAIVDATLDPDGLKIYFKNAEYAFIPHAASMAVSENWSFRYIVIPRSKYQSLAVDWNDLAAVASALNFSL